MFVEFFSMHVSKECCSYSFCTIVLLCSYSTCSLAFLNYSLLWESVGKVKCILSWNKGNKSSCSSDNNYFIKWFGPIDLKEQLTFSFLTNVHTAYWMVPRPTSTFTASNLKCSSLLSSLQYMHSWLSSSPFVPDMNTPSAHIQTCTCLCHNDYMKYHLMTWLGLLPRAISSE